MATESKAQIDHVDKLWWWIATWFGCGMSPIASGTVGSLGAIPFAYLIADSFGNGGLAVASLILFVIGCWASHEYMKHTGKHDDPREIVVDEVAGMWLLISMLFGTWHSYVFAFFAFRVFDVLKPWPIYIADEKITGGFGVMFDDILAAIYPVVIYIILALLGMQRFLMPIMQFLGFGNVYW